MRTALNSPALLAIFNQEPGTGKWMGTLITARQEGSLLVCDVVYSEIAPAFASRAELDEQPKKLGVVFDFIEREGAFLAGETFRRCRAAGGPRKNMIPDFLIAAHARAQCDRLAAEDRGYLQRYFPELRLLGQKSPR